MSFEQSTPLGIPNNIGTPLCPRKSCIWNVALFITAFDDMLARVFGERLADSFSSRVLPVSTLPLPRDMTLLFDSKYRQIQALLVPGKRQRDNARGLIRTLLALESHVVDEVEANEADVLGVERVARSGQPWNTAFPRLSQIHAEFQGEGQHIIVRIGRCTDSDSRSQRSG